MLTPINWNRLIADRAQQSSLSDGDFLTWAAARIVDPNAPQQVSCFDFKSYLQSMNLWARLDGAALNPSSVGFPVASPAKSFIEDVRNNYVDFRSPLGIALMQGLVATGIFSQADYDAAVAAFFAKSPNDSYGGVVTQGHLDAIPCIVALDALKSRCETASIQVDTLRVQILNGGSPAIPAWADLGN